MTWRVISLRSGIDCVYPTFSCLRLIRERTDFDLHNTDRVNLRGGWVASATVGTYVYPPCVPDAGTLRCIQTSRCGPIYLGS
jgi:hypothetical protein